MTYASSRTLSICEPGLIKVCLPHHSLWLKKSDTLTKRLWPFHCFSIMPAALSISEVFCSQTGQKKYRTVQKSFWWTQTAPIQIGFTNCNGTFSIPWLYTNQQTWSANMLVRNVNSSLWRMKDCKDKHYVVQIRSIRLVSWLLCWFWLTALKYPAGREASWEISKYLIKDKHTYTHTHTHTDTPTHTHTHSNWPSHNNFQITSR